MAIGFNNEEIGVSAEIAIADTFNVEISSNYRQRGFQDVVDKIGLVIDEVFSRYSIPHPVKHIAEDQNPIDFLLHNESTLSVKTNQGSLGKAAPQKIGQPTSYTYFKHFSHIINEPIPQTYEEKRNLFKLTSIDKIDVVISEYWNNMFDCDYLIHFYDIVSRSGILTRKPSYVVFGRFGKKPKWEKENFSFTQTVESWNESCTVKYCNIAIGEFQAHQNRDCFKFRFNMDGVLRLLKRDLI